MRHEMLRSFLDAAPLYADGVEPRLANALADELVALTVLLSDLAYDLGSQPETLRRHMSSLQSVDLITQTQLAIADVLRCSGSCEERLSGITLESLSHRLNAALRPETVSDES